MDVDMQCTYCGKKWRLIAQSQWELMNAKCGVCGDKHIKMKDLSKETINYYQGSPPFPNKIDWGDF